MGFPRGLPSRPAVPPRKLPGRAADLRQTRSGWRRDTGRTPRSALPRHAGPQASDLGLLARTVWRPTVTPTWLHQELASSRDRALMHSACPGRPCVVGDTLWYGPTGRGAWPRAPGTKVAFR